MKYTEMTSDQLQEALIALDKVIDDSIVKDQEFFNDSELDYDRGVDSYLLALQLRRKFIINTFIENFGYNPDNLCTTSN